MDELRVIKPNKNNHISHDDLQWIGANACHFICAKCGHDYIPLYEAWGNEGEYYCAKCLIADWEEASGDSS